MGTIMQPTAVVIFSNKLVLAIDSVLGNKPKANFIQKHAVLNSPILSKQSHVKGAFSVFHPIG